MTREPVIVDVILLYILAMAALLYVAGVVEAVRRKRRGAAVDPVDIIVLMLVGPPLFAVIGLSCAVVF